MLDTHFCSSRWAYKLHVFAALESYTYMFKLQNTDIWKYNIRELKILPNVSRPLFLLHISITVAFYLIIIFKLNCVFVLDVRWSWLWYRELLRLERCEILIPPNIIPRVNDSELIARLLREIIYFKLIDSRLHESYTHHPRLRYMNYNSYQFLAWQGQTFIFQFYLYRRPVDFIARIKWKWYTFIE